jgi:hypothetical protein
VEAAASNASASGNSDSQTGRSGAQSGWVSIRRRPDDPDRPASLKRNKKADVVENPKAFDHVGLLVNEPPGQAGLPFI